MTINISKPLFIIVIALLWVGSAHAQEATTAAGGDASNTDGSVAYSVGQIVYTTILGNNGSVAQGVQQPYEIYIVSGIENTTINLAMAVYPNPTTDFLQLEVTGEISQALSFQLVDMEGKIIESRKIVNATETIDMGLLASAPYLLKVSNKNKIIKTFKIIKN